MTTEKVNDLEVVSLKEYFTPDKFRTVPGTAMMTAGGISEIQVIFNINKDFADKLNFEFSSMLIIYGFGIMNKKLKEINGYDYISYMGEGSLKRITLNDCGEKFIMVLELSDAPDKLLAVKADEVLHLLNHCMHPRL